jgi:hypothetical protein
MVFSSVFGLRVWSNQAIPGLPPLPSVSGIDVQVWLGEMPVLSGSGSNSASQTFYANGSHSPGSEPVLRVWKVAEGKYFRLQYKDGTEFLIEKTGSQVWGTWPEPWTLEDTAVYLLGPVFGFLLRLRGVVCLHASAIEVDGRAIVLQGPAGAGKSTTAAAFARLGLPVLSDDIVAVGERREGFMVRPGNPRLRLWPDSVRALFGNPDALPRLTPNWDKCYFDLAAPRSESELRSLPLDAVYMLSMRQDNESAPCISGTAARESLIDLIANTYTNYLLDPEMRANEFRLLSRLIASVPVRRVVPHTDPASLSRLCEVILADHRRLASITSHAAHASGNGTRGSGVGRSPDRAKAGGGRLEGT